MLVSLLVCFHLLGVLLDRTAWPASWLRLRHSHLRYRRSIPDTGTSHFRYAAKPAWVRHEVIRLKALMPYAGCRALADIFNRRFAARRCIDLTGKQTIDGSTRMVLGILEHASRAALWLEALETKSSWTLILKLIGAIRRYGRPRAIRTDNETVFTAKTFRFALLLLGIRHQRTDPGCPWQNGRVERFFGTLKEKLDRLAVDSLEALNDALGEFRFFYNHVRPHQNLGGCTPAEGWSGDNPFARPPGREYWFEAWEGLLTGHYFKS